MSLTIKGSGLTIADVVKVARHREKVELDRSALQRIEKCRAMLERKIEAKEIMYGVNTGIGEFSEIVLNDDQVREFQKYLIYNHAAGIGDAMPIEHVRGAMLGRINVHAHGNSGIRPVITLTLVEMLNKGVTPFVCEKGSVGASGDLAPMSQIALLMLGEGKAFYKGELLEGREAMDKAGIAIPGLHARDGLGIINGSNVLTAMSALFLYDADNWLKQAEIAAAMSLEALKANMGPYTEKLHEVRGFKGAVRSARSIGKLVTGGDLKSGKVKHKVQDAYSMRSTPQVIGAAHDALAYAREQVEIELNGVGDNPVFFPEENIALSGANFQGTPVSLPMDMAGAAITMVSVLSERAAADQEDFVSMGMNTALKNNTILDNAYGILGIEFMAAAQALDFRDYQFGRGVRKAHQIIRQHVEFLDVDRPLYADHNTMKKLVKGCEILREVEKTVGPLDA
ncbi:MAG: aromatic amino acid ammonia-lyase [bacterium]